jgi:hypothetical protein
MNLFEEIRFIIRKRILIEFNLRSGEVLPIGRTTWGEKIFLVFRATN